MSRITVRTGHKWRRGYVDRRSNGSVRHYAPMESLREGQKIWVEQPDGSQRAGIFVGDAEASWFGGSPGAYVVYPDTNSGAEVAILRVVPRDDGE